MGTSELMESGMAALGTGSDVPLATELARVQHLARAEPARVAHRGALFQLQCIAGAWDKAARQLAVLADLDPTTELFASQHRALLACEAERAEVFAGRQSPSCLGRPPGWFPLLVEALRLDGAAEHGAAKVLREQAFAQAEATPGQLDGAAFAWIADADERLGPVLEAVLNGRYLWVPFDRLRRIETEPPQDLKDLVWLPAKLTLANGAEAAGFVPTRCPGSEAMEDDAIRLARRTEWRQLGGEGSWVGLGQRMLATDHGEHALLEVRAIELRPAAGGDA
jgi:type VI secretion system protein ImpE